MMNVNKIHGCKKTGCIVATGFFSLSETGETVV